MRPILFLAAMALPLAACDRKAEETDKAVDKAQLGGTLENGSVSLDLGGVKASLALPATTGISARTDFDGMKPHPGTNIHGVDIRATDTEGGVTMAFTDPAAPGTVLDYYRAEAPKAGFTVSEAGADAVLLSKGDDRITITATAAGAGSTGSFRMSDKN